jgi:hypothetical protein
VKKIIQNRDRPQYLKPDGTWTSDIGEAWRVENIQEAIAAVTVHQLEAVELLYLLGEQPGQYDFAVPLSDAPKDSHLHPPGHRE